MTNRREFVFRVATAASLLATPAAFSSGKKPEVAFTFDDPATNDKANLRWQEVNERILASLSSHKIKSVLFVCGMRVDSNDGRKLITAWDNEGHMVGSHSYSHLFFDKVPLAEFEADFLKNEPLVTPYHNFSHLFRYPYFKEGDTVEKRDGMRSLLKQHGYRHGRATIDASDWAINARLEARIKENPQADLADYRAFFLQHIWERARFYDSLAQRVLNGPVRHTVLLHHNLLNALFFGDLVGMFIQKGWRPVDAKYAYMDSVYDSQPQTLPAGEGLIWALAKQRGAFEAELRYPAEDDVYENPKMDAMKL